MTVFEFDDFRKFIEQKVLSMPKKGYGQYRKIALHLGVSTVMISQVLKGDRLLPLESAFELTKYFALTDLECKYFLLLVQYARAGSIRFKEHLKKELSEIKKKSKIVKEGISVDRELEELAKPIFYSDWIYSAVRLVSSIEGYNDLEVIAERFKTPVQTIRPILEFLLQHGLCVQKGNKIQMGPSRTHLEAHSPFVKQRQMSWRMKAFEEMNRQSEAENLFYTAPMALSQEVREEVHLELLKIIKKLNQIVPPSRSEELMCLNIDWFGF